MRYSNIYDFCKDYPLIALESQEIVKKCNSSMSRDSKINKIRRVLARKYHSDQTGANEELIRVVNDFCDKLRDDKSGWMLKELMSIDLTDFINQKNEEIRKLNKFKDRLNNYYFKLAENRVYVDSGVIENIYMMMKDIYDKIENDYKLADINNCINDFVRDVKKKYNLDLDSDRSFKEQLDNVKNNEKNDEYKYSYDDKNGKDELVRKEELFKKIIIATMIKFHKGSPNLKKGDATSGYDYLRNFINSNFILAITNDEKFGRLRDQAKGFLDSSDVKMIVANSGIFGDDRINSLYGISNNILNYIDTVMLNYIIKCVETRFPNNDALGNINAYIKNGNLIYITNSIGEARLVAKNLSGDRIKELFSGYGVVDIYEYYDKIYNENNFGRGR